MDYLVIFHTYSGAIKLEKELKKMGIPFETMPAPRHLSVDCGVSLKFKTDTLVEEIISSIHTQNIHKIFKVIDNKFEIVFLNE